MKNIKDYLPFYIGATCVADGNVFTLCGVEILPEGTCAYTGERKDGIPQGWWVENCDFKLALKKLSTYESSEEDKVDRKYLLTMDNFKNYNAVNHAAAATKYLCSKGYDVFKLIESGLAIDITTLKQ